MSPTLEMIILLGPPGSGKGTQATAIANRLEIPHVASGDLLRAHRIDGTPLGKAAQAAMDQGELVPDELVSEMVLQRLAEPDAAAGALLDGFPRTVAQAETLDDYLRARGGRVRAVVELHVAPERLVARLAGRRTCPACQESFHVLFKQPRVAETCDHCGAALVQRTDDRASVVRNRVAVYARQTEPLIDYYARQGVLQRIDGDQPIERIGEDLARTLPAPAFSPALT